LVWDIVIVKKRMREKIKQPIETTEESQILRRATEST
jgi:hypothetical protein